MRNLVLTLLPLAGLSLPWLVSSGSPLALAIYAWGVLIGCIAFGPTFSRLLADIAPMTTPPPEQIPLRTRRRSTPDQNRNLAP